MVVFAIIMALLTALRTAGFRLEQEFRNHHEFLLLLILFVSLRLSLLVVSRPQGYLLGISDYDFYLEFGRLADRGLYPALQYWTEYPPVFPWLAVAVYKATAVIPNLHGSPIYWFRLTLGTSVLLFDIGNLILIYWLGRRLHAPQRALQIGWTYALLFIPLHVWLGWFDTMPLFFLLLATALLVDGRLRFAAFVSGLGFMVKVFPILALPILLKIERSNLRRAALLAICALGVALIAAPFLIQAPGYLVASFQSMLSRGAWETPWALAEGYYGYGWVAPLDQRMDPSTATRTTHDGFLPWPAITALFGALYLYVWTRRLDLRRATVAVALVGFTVNFFLLYNKGYSPQFLAYVVPFVILVLPPLRAVLYLATLTALTLLEYPVYGALFNDQHWLMRDLIILRTVLLLFITWEYLVALGLAPAIHRFRRVLATSLVMGVVVWLGVTVPALGQDWGVRVSLERHPHAPLLDYLLANADSHSVVVFTEPWLYRELYPHLRQHTEVILVDPPEAEESDSQDGSGRAGTSVEQGHLGSLDWLSLQHRDVYGVRHSKDSNGMRLEWLIDRYAHLQAARKFGDLTVMRWSTGP